jgi:hypothetical protein
MSSDPPIAPSPSSSDVAVHVAVHVAVAGVVRHVLVSHAVVLHPAVVRVGVEGLVQLHPPCHRWVDRGPQQLLVLLGGVPDVEVDGADPGQHRGHAATGVQHLELPDRAVAGAQQGRSDRRDEQEQDR